MYPTVLELTDLPDSASRELGLKATVPDSFRGSLPSGSSPSLGGTLGSPSRLASLMPSDLLGIDQFTWVEWISNPSADTQELIA